jgi:hypothetical protein
VMMGMGLLLTAGSLAASRMPALRQP